MNTVIFYILCGSPLHITLITSDKTLMYKPEPPAYIDIIKRTEGKFQTVKANLDQVLQGQCS